MPIEVNLAGIGDGSLFGPGYVARYVQNGIAHTAGEGLSPLQWPFESLQNAANQVVWGKQMEDIISKSRKKPR